MITADNIMNLTAFFSMQGVVVMLFVVYGVCILIFGDEMYVEKAMARLVLRHEGRFCSEMVWSFLK